MAAGRHGSHVPTSIVVGCTCRRSGTDDCGSGRQSEGAHAIANHGRPHGCVEPQPQSSIVNTGTSGMRDTWADSHNSRWRSTRRHTRMAHSSPRSRRCRRSDAGFLDPAGSGRSPAAPWRARLLSTAPIDCACAAEGASTIAVARRRLRVSISWHASLANFHAVAYRASDDASAGPPATVVLTGVPVGPQRLRERAFGFAAAGNGARRTASMFSQVAAPQARIVARRRQAAAHAVVAPGELQDVVEHLGRVVQQQRTPAGPGRAPPPRPRCRHGARRSQGQTTPCPGRSRPLRLLLSVAVIPSYRAAPFRSIFAALSIVRCARGPAMTVRSLVA